MFGLLMVEDLYSATSKRLTTSIDSSSLGSKIQKRRRDEEEEEEEEEVAPKSKKKKKKVKSKKVAFGPPFPSSFSSSSSTSPFGDQYHKIEQDLKVKVKKHRRGVDDDKFDAIIDLVGESNKRSELMHKQMEQRNEADKEFQKSLIRGFDNNVRESALSRELMGQLIHHLIKQDEDK